MKAPTRLAPNRNLEGRERARRAGHHRDGRAGLHHRGDGQARARQSGAGQARQERGSINYAADYVMDALDDYVGAIDEDIVVTTTIDLDDAGRGRAGADGRAQRQGRQVRRRAGRAGRARSRRRGQGDGRRAQLCRQPVQSRRRGQAPARLVVQALRLSGGAGEGADARHGARGRADHDQGLEPGKLFARIFRPGDADARRWRSRSTRSPCGWAIEVGPKAVVATAHRLGITSDLEPSALDRARLLGGDAARDGLPPTRPSPMAASASSRM